MSTSTADTTITTRDTSGTCSAPFRRRWASTGVTAALAAILAAGCTTTTGSSDPLAIAEAAGSVPPVTATAAPTVAPTPPPTTTTTPQTSTPQTSAPQTSAPQASAPQTSAPQTTTAPTPVPVPEPEIAVDPGCGAWPAIPSTASGVSSVTIDALGDGTADDTITTYLDGTWRLRLESAAGVVSEVTIDDVGPGYAEVIGAIQVDEQVADQVLAVVGSGASGVRLGVFGADEQGCVFRFTHGDGSAPDLMVGGTAGWHRGVFCAGSTLFSYGADAVGDDEWHVWGVDLQRSGATTLDHGMVDSQPGVSTDDLPVYGLACPGLTL